MCCCCVSCCWLVVVRRLSWIVVCVFLLFVISWLLGCWLMAVVCSLFVVWYCWFSWFVVRCWWLVVGLLLFDIFLIVWGLLLRGSCCMLCVVCCLQVFVVCCLLLIVVSFVVDVPFAFL